MTNTSSAEKARFFTADQLAVVEALVADIIPSDEKAAGAREAGVADFIDTALMGHDAPWQTAYEQGVNGFDAYVRARHGHPYQDLDDDTRIALLEGLANGSLEGSEEPWVSGFFGVLWQHTVQGFLSDPIYGGNRDMVGWKAVGFPGAQYGYGPEYVVGNKVSLPMPQPMSAMREQVEKSPERFFNAY